MATDPTQARLLGWGIEYDAFKHMDMRMASFDVAVIKNESSGGRFAVIRLLVSV